MTEPRFLDRKSPPHLVTLILLSGVSALSMNIFLPSLPNMTAYFQTDYRLMQLSISVYLAFSAVLQMVIGPLSDRFGRRNILVASLVVFNLATLGTLLAPDVTTFLAFRMLQAAVATAMALSRAIVRDMVDEARAASMIAYVTLGMSIVPMLGPIIGGKLDEVFGWHASFGLMLILGLLVLWLVWADLGETVVRRPSSFRKQLADYPELLTSPRFWGYVLSTAFASGVFFAYLGGAPFVGSELYGLTPAELGFYFGVTGLGYGAGNYLSGRFSVRMGVIRMIVTGNMVMVAGMVLQVLAVATGWGGALGFFLPFLLIGTGNGLVLPNSNAGMLSVRPQLAGTASGLGGAIMIGGGAALSALAGSWLTLETGAWPLLIVMGASLLGSILSILLVIRRNKQLGL
ncbi:MAG: multidrug effflux MFS transporter [Rhodobacter sp.]|uniref:multidrug effflux MFS transporter n=1 Tax=Pararhodobacter sp. TaxID=2127056 RepID=UPI001D38080C|nr:multidrug effflux MFS transporter [Pararhodobacter sp.]MCB1346436.1 multidrug effflux MFS transporter [Paracoccaceae bacterium]MCB1408774.1 multidrug effflux MFS transporter [Paracoccaceae bacterium]MCC0073224.1 multidrug effflux MFS transporter [Rhodobacter sp.]HPD91592.1 multidrug effflux MFS transporter [Pararhodobacter sp.]